MENMDNHHKIIHSNPSPQKYKLPEGKRMYRKKTGGWLRRNHSIWAVTVTAVSFLLSISILFASSGLFEKIAPHWSFFVVFVIVLIGVLFDLVGVAVTAADEKPFHSMASKKYKGARQAIKLIRNADKVASVCNDVVGDICGVVSGTAGAAIVFRFFSGAVKAGWAEAIVGGLIAAITVGGKAFAKKYGISSSHTIISRVGSFLAFFIPSNGKKT